MTMWDFHTSAEMKNKRDLVSVGKSLIVVPIGMSEFVNGPNCGRNNYVHSLWITGK